MEYCKYHPLAAATFACPECQISLCDGCVDESGYGEQDRCFACGNIVSSLGAANSVAPFWRRLPESFRYPMSSAPLGLIIGISLISTLLSSVPSLITFLLWVAVTGVMVKYCFLCLQHSSSGRAEAPAVGDAFSGGVSLIINIIGILIALGGMVYAAGLYLGEGVAGGLSLLFTLGLPAVIINYAVTESFSEAINPMNMLRLMGSLGLSYGVLLAFLLILSASVGIISSLIGDGLTLLTAALQSVVSYYYMVVTFHILGYIIFQHQEALGFVARGDFGGTRSVRPERERLLSRLDVLIKEGRRDEVVAGYSEAVKRYPDDRQFQLQCFDLLHACGNVEALSRFAPEFFSFLERTGRGDQLYGYYRKLLQLNPGYQPPAAELRHQLARACQRAGNARLAVKLLAGLHRDYPNYDGLSDAYRLLADSLDEMPNMSGKAAQVRRLVGQWSAADGVGAGQSGDKDTKSPA
ncbi:DUF4013 domain-containing protein [Motiliproteus sediminis]|uniref:DUF4013 domain-containing protein n=1 Tax=Motiliproteus sediminis TaxID=1468178 RepID=UPI001AEF4C43|nr:DUF4013 domain-containing protein [Motiliproteus sediminis]